MLSLIDTANLRLDSSAFQSALSSNADDLQRLFAGNNIARNLSDNTDSTGLADLLISSIATYTSASTGMLVMKSNRLDQSISDIADDRLDVIARMESLEERYTRQFTAMDTLVSQLQGPVIF